MKQSSGRYCPSIVRYHMIEPAQVAHFPASLTCCDVLLTFPVLADKRIALIQALYHMSTACRYEIVKNSTKRCTDGKVVREYDLPVLENSETASGAGEARIRSRQVSRVW